jgi:hypothetical protein
VLALVVVWPEWPVVEACCRAVHWCRKAGAAFSLVLSRVAVQFGLEPSGAGSLHVHALHVWWHEAPAELLLCAAVAALLALHCCTQCMTRVVVC